MKNNSFEDFKNIIQSKWVVAFFLMMTTFLYDVVLFAQNGMSFSSFVYFIILIGCYFAWVFSLFLGKKITTFFLIINFLIFCVLKEYYKFHTFPLKLDMVLNLYKEGLIAGFKNTTSLFDSGFWFFFILLLIQIKMIWKKSFYNLKKACLLGFVFLISGCLYVNFMIWGTENTIKLLYPNLFLSYQQGLLYKIKWPMELFLPKDNQIHKLIFNGNKSLRDKMGIDNIALSHLPNHIYLIQVESLTTVAIENMPFFKQMMINNSKYYVDKNHEHCIGSGNTDFMMMSGFSLDCEKSHTLVYYAYPVEIYEKIKPLPFVLKEKGYQTIFLHGYKGDFFNRNKHYSSMGFDEIYFEENFPNNTPKGEWGIGDYSLLKFVSSLKLKEKSFLFIITSGMHPPYEIPEEKNSKKIQSREDINSYLKAVSFLDDGLKELYLSSPDDSLFIIYGDHNIPDIKAFDTPVLLFYKGNQNLIIKGEKEEGFNQTTYFINSLFDERN
ncbi:MAG: sulfatase-like hydrolase/transferase [Alphaproteobacteria bacterium]|nr:sulfatase-like hydrolase/transferase [Alphaproteobacteria bacterium]